MNYEYTGHIIVRSTDKEENNKYSEKVSNLIKLFNNTRIQTEYTGKVGQNHETVVMFYSAFFNFDQMFHFYNTLKYFCLSNYIDFSLEFNPEISDPLKFSLQFDDFVKQNQKK